MSLETTVPIVSVDDLAAALDHYQGALGFKRDWTWGEPATLAGLYRDRIELQLAQRGKLGPPGTSHVYLRGSGVDALFEELRAAGVEILEPIADRPYGLRDFAVLDPSGNRLDFGAPLGEAKVVAPPVESLKIFVPAQDFAVSKRFTRRSASASTGRRATSPSSRSAARTSCSRTTTPGPGPRTS
jgi:uncharacterized glyoxalase superfamily protein PhnB